MKKDLKSRLRELAWDITSIGNFNYAPQYDYRIRDVELMARRVSRDFPGVYDVIGSSYPILEMVNQESISGLDFSKITKWEKQVRVALTKLRSDPEYKRLKKAYESDDQIKVADALPNVFVNYEKDILIEPGQKCPQLFHGVTILSGMNSAEYLEFCLKISRDGLRPSPYGIHMDMDRNIRPIYMAPNELGSHGLIALTFKPEKHTIVLENNEREARIYTPRLKANFGFALRDIDTLTSYSPDDGVNLPNDKVEQFLNDLEDCLRSKQIHFTKIKIPNIN